MQISAMNLLHLLLLSAACLLSSEGVCHNTSTNLSIINGHEAIRNSRPYMAYISFTNLTHDLFCGGILIKTNWVLTAAHCWLPRSNAKVILGAHSSDPHAQECERQTFYVSQRIFHPEYNSVTFNNDLQLIKLNGRARMGLGVQVLCLPWTYEDMRAGTVCETAGWGLTEKNKNAEFLMEVKVSTITSRECRKRFPDAQIEGIENKICVSVGCRGEGPCLGDSGGPLICDGVFRGVLSFGNFPCGIRGNAAVYTRLSEEYINWIHEMTTQ
ncbi:hypothetical protein GDO81_002797 [Engystomops pustulosus]|uniref:Peptidase S1 domain-containing protein n=1 Tax=Engystomops pustulosus TaxID=76066 RepID=A0AAV7DQW8_ENGPU|nr:hypothetical protein GDO81_002797 [Engystomops pustulosus]